MGCAPPTGLVEDSHQYGSPDALAPSLRNDEQQTQKRSARHGWALAVIGHEWHDGGYTDALGTVVGHQEPRLGITKAVPDPLQPDCLIRPHAAPSSAIRSPIHLDCPLDVERPAYPHPDRHPESQSFALARVDELRPSYHPQHSAFAMVDGEASSELDRFCGLD